MNSETVLDILERTRFEADQWVFLRELRAGTGYEKGAMQRIDAWAMNFFPSNQWERLAFEVKVSRGDFLSEIRNPCKRRFAMSFSNRFYFVAPAGLLQIDEIPVDCGFIEVVQGDYRQHWRGRRYSRLLALADPELASIERVEAPWRDCHPPSWSMVGAIVRNLRKTSFNKVESMALRRQEAV